MPAQSYVTIAQALASSQTGLLVQDSAAAIAGALPNSALVARVTAFSLSASALITAAVADKLAALGSKFQPADAPIVVQDTVAAMNAASNAAGLALATSRTIIDAAYNLLSASASSFTHVSNVILTGAPTLSVAQLTKLEGLPGFSVQTGAQVTLQDSLTDFVPALSAHGTWFNTVATLSVRLDGSQITAAGVASLAALANAGKTITFVAGMSDTALNITATAHDLAGVAAAVNQLGGMVGLHISVSNESAAITVADALALMGITGFSPAAHTLYVADTGAAISANAAALFGHGFPEILVSSGNFAGSATQLLDTTLHVASGATVSMTGSASLTAAQAQTLSILPGFVLASGATLAVSDTAAHILANASGLGAATSITITDSETVSASGLSTLALLAASHPGHFSLGSQTLSVSDTAANLLALPGQAVALATSFALSAAATVTAAQFTTLRDTLHTSPAGHAVTVLDSAAHLLALSGSLSLATACVLTGPAVVSAANAQTLVAEPGFSTGGYALGISDTAANLLALPAPLQDLASSLTLASSQTVSLTQLAVLVGWGAKFGTGGHSLTVAGTAADLAALTSPELGLVTGATLTQSATLSGAAAAALVALPGFTVAAGASLTVQDSAANLLSLSSTVLSVAAAEKLPAGAVTLTAATASQLHGLTHFSAAGATITVSDTVANLNAVGHAGWQAVASHTQVVDNAANLIANAGSTLLLNATAVTLSVNGTITAAQATILAGLPNYSNGSYALTVSDGAIAIAGNEPAILSIGTQAVVTDTGPVSAAQAATLALLSAAGKLVFLGSDQLVVADSYANLTAGGNAAGLALAAGITITDSAANLITATSHDWGSRVPNYLLSGNAVLSGAQATTLAAQGSHFGFNGHTASIADTASAVVAAGSAMTSLGISAAVTDSAANVGGHEAALAGLGASLSRISLTDTAPVSGAVAAALSPLATTLTGAALLVQDNAAGVDSHLSALSTLGSHVAITVLDSAAAIGPDAADFASLGAAVTIALTDANAVSAAVAAALSPLAAHLAAGTALAVNDSAANVAGAAASLAAMSAGLGTITLSSGSGVTVAQAVALQPLDAHLGNGVLLAVTGNATQIALNATVLHQLAVDGHVFSIADLGDSAASVATNAAGLNLAGATVSVSDTLAHITANLSALTNVAGLNGVTVTDVNNPTFTQTISQYATDAGVLGYVTNAHVIAINDSATAIEADLAAADSVILSIPGTLTITTTGGVPLVLSQSVALAPGLAAVLSSLTVPLQVTGVDLAHITAVMALSPQSVTISDTAAHVQQDLLLNSPLLVGDIAQITAVNVQPSGVITLSASAALVAHVDDGPASVLGEMTGGTLNVSGATIAQLPSLLALQVPPHAIAVNDTAAAITAALINSNSPVFISAGAVVSLHVTDGQPVVLTAAQDLAAGVSDTATAALTKLSGSTVDVTGVLTSQLAAVEGTARLPDQVNVSDTAAHLVTALSSLLTDLPNLGAITVTAGTVTLSAAQALTAHVADGAGSLVSLLPGQSYAVTGATIAQVASLASLAQPPTTIAVADTSTALAADLSAGYSQWAAHVGSVTVTGGTLTLTDAQAEFIAGGGINRVGDLHALGSGQIIDITGVPIADLANFAGYAASLQGGVTLHLEVADSALDLANDLASGTPVLTQEAAYVQSVALTGAGGTLTPAQLNSVAGISGLTTNGVTVPVSGGAAAVVGLSVGAQALAGSVTVTDTAAAVHAQLNALQSEFGGAHLTITLTGNPAFTVDAATYSADHATIAAITNVGGVTVTGSASVIGSLEPTLAADAHVAAVQITDSAANVVANLDAITALGGLASVTLNDAVSISASLANALVNAALPSLSAGSLVVADTGSQIAAMAESGSAAASFLTAQGAQLTADSNVMLVDAAALNGLGGALNLNGHVVNVWDTAAHLTQPGAAAELASLVGAGLVNAIYLKTGSGAVTVSAAQAAALLGVSGLNVNNPDASVNTITVSDTAAHLDTNYATLQANLGSLTHVVVNASATVTYAILTDLQALGAMTGGGVALTLSDTAGNILSASAVASPTIQASAWNLIANASVTLANAIVLAGLPNFSSAGHTLTVVLGADTPVTVSQANNLATLGLALIVTTHNLTLAGSASALSGLTHAAAGVVHVALTDTLANISAIAANSASLSGTIAVSDAESLTAAQASSFLSLMTTAGVAPGSISFGGHVETVTDSIASLAALTSSTAWTSNGALQSHFSLVASDTVSNLTNPANATFLNGLAGQSLSVSSVVNASSAASLAALSSFGLAGHTLTVSDTAANLLAPGAAAGVALGTSVTLSAAASVNAASAESLLQLPHFVLTQPLTITDNSANLLDGTLSGLISGHAQVHVALAGAETLDAQTAAALVSLQGFNDTTDMHIVDTSSYLLAPGASAAEAMAASVSLDGNEIVSANTVLRLSALPHFSHDGGTLTLAGNDFANAVTLKAIGDMGAHFSEGGHSLSLTQDDLALTPTELAAINADGFLGGVHLVSALLVNTGVTDASNVLSLSATGVAGASVHIYGSSGSLISATHEANAGFTVSAPDVAGTAFSITEVVNGVESAPVVVLDATALENAVAGTSAIFASSGQIQVDTGKYINLYTAGSQLPNAPALVYDPHAHTISLDIPSSAPVTLITLGASTSPSSIDPSEILVKHHS